MACLREEAVLWHGKALTLFLDLFCLNNNTWLEFGYKVTLLVVVLINILGLEKPLKFLEKGT